MTASDNVDGNVGGNIPSSSFSNLYSTLSIRALKDASIIFSDTPTVYQLFLFLSELSIETLVVASVPVFKILTL